MEPALDDLIMMGKTVMEFTCRTGTFFFPKIAVCRKGSEDIEVGQYESTLDQLEDLLGEMASFGPIEWIAHTADSYDFRGDSDHPDDVALTQRVVGGEITLGELFDDGDPRVCEAMSVLVVSADGEQMVMVPYHRMPGNRLEWETPRPYSAENMARQAFIHAVRNALNASLV